MTDKRIGSGPAPLDKQQIDKLLDLLESDEGFRSAFEASPQVALARIGYTATAAGGCLTFTDGARLASAEKIREARASLEAALSKPFTHECPVALRD